MVLSWIVAMLLLRVFYVFRYPMDSDEPQHLHVVWGWLHGLLPYRDIFDNHTPLFHMLCTPLLAVAGERPETLYIMRLAMIPLFLLALGSTYWLGRELYSKRAGLWAALFVGLFPSFFLCSVEFRTDDLWTVCWLGALEAMVRGRVTVARSLVSGLLLGAAVGVSLKTTLMLIALGGASVATLVCFWERRPRPFVSWSLTRVVGFLCGLVLIPCALSGHFYARGAWKPFLYGTVQHNIVPGAPSWRISPEWALGFLVAVALLHFLALRTARHAPSQRTALRRVFILWVAGIYMAALVCFWPLVTLQDFLPVVPLIFVVLTPWILLAAEPREGGKADRRGRRLPHRSWTLPAVALAEIGLLLAVGTPWHDGTHPQIALVADTLRLTRPDETVMDLKGEVVFRRRPFYFGLETITNERMRLGWIADTIPEHLVAARTCVTTEDLSHFPPRARSFIQDHYLSVGRLRVLGQVLEEPAAGANQPIGFDVIIPADYAIVSENSVAKGQLDGISYDGVRHLEAGHHTFYPDGNCGKMALIWSRAVERGFSPFPLWSKSP